MPISERVVHLSIDAVRADEEIGKGTDSIYAMAHTDEELEKAIREEFEGASWYPTVEQVISRLRENNTRHWEAWEEQKDYWASPGFGGMG